MRKGKTLGTLGGLILVLILAVLIGFAWLGYFARDPFTLVPPTGPARRDVAAIVLSGDMGFHVGMGPQIARRLSADGIGVVGVNALSYFRTTRTPAEATALIIAAIAKARATYHPAHLLLIGQSFGADMLHVGLAGLPPVLRRDVAMVALIVPGNTVEYRASPSEVLTFLMDEYGALPTANQMDWAPMLCVFGREERNSLCPLLHNPNVHSVALPGGHPLHFDAGAVYRQIKAAMARAAIVTRDRKAKLS